jgi:hypothetical protein
MKIEDITEPHNYHYSRRRGAVVKTGEIAVIEVYKRLNGWHIVGQDVATLVVITLRPSHILSRVKSK